MRFEVPIRLDAVVVVVGDPFVGDPFGEPFSVDPPCRSLFPPSTFPLPSISLVAFSTFTMCSHIALVFLEDDFGEAFQNLHYTLNPLSGSAWADVNLAEIAQELGKMVD